jgi:thiol-disulfide isomerase/thioredoxin
MELRLKEPIQFHALVWYYRFSQGGVMRKAFFSLILGLSMAQALVVDSRADAQSTSKAAANSEGSKPVLTVVPNCPIQSVPEKSTKTMEIEYFPSRPGGAIRDPHSLTLRLAFDSPYTPDKDRTIAFERQNDGRWKATVPVMQRFYAIWYVRDETTGQRDDNHGQYWDLVFCAGDGRKLDHGVLLQAQGYAGAIFSADIKRPTDYERAIEVLESSIDIADARSCNLISEEWAFKFALRGGGKLATTEFVEEVQRGLSEHGGKAGFVQGTALFLINHDKAFPPNFVDQAITLSDRVVPHPGMIGVLKKQRAENLKDPRERAQALGQWVADYPDEHLVNFVRKERMEIFVKILGDVSAAEELFHDLEKRTPHDPDLYATMASAYIAAAGQGQRFDLDQALKLLDKAEGNLEVTGSQSGPIDIVTLSLGDNDQQRAIINFWRGRARFQQQKYNEAEAFLERSAPVLKDSRRAWDAYLWLGRTQEQLQEWTRAKSSYLEAALQSSGSTDKFVELSLKTGTPSREAALRELAGAQKRIFDAAHYKPALVDLAVPDFTFTTATGKQITASSLREQIVILDLWATWCGPCVWELSGFAKLKQAHPEVRVLLAAMDSTAPEIEKALRQNGFSPEDVVLADDTNATKFGLGGVPQTYLIDKNSRIRIVHYGALPDVVWFIESDLAALESATTR